MKLLGKADVLEIVVALGLLACTLFMFACVVGVVQYIVVRGCE